MSNTWEYCIEFCATALSVKRLNELGADGWEHYAVSGNAYYFKRLVKVKEETAPQPKKEHGNKGKR